MSYTALFAGRIVTRDDDGGYFAPVQHTEFRTAVSMQDRAAEVPAIHSIGVRRVAHVKDAGHADIEHELIHAGLADAEVHTDLLGAFCRDEADDGFAGIAGVAVRFHRERLLSDVQGLGLGMLDPFGLTFDLIGDVRLGDDGEIAAPVAHGYRCVVRQDDVRLGLDDRDGEILPGYGDGQAAAAVADVLIRILGDDGNAGIAGITLRGLQVDPIGSFRDGGLPGVGRVEDQIALLCAGEMELVRHEEFVQTALGEGLAEGFRAGGDDQGPGAFPCFTVDIEADHDGTAVGRGSRRFDLGPFGVLQLCRPLEVADHAEFKGLDDSAAAVGAADVQDSRLLLLLFLLVAGREYGEQQ